MQEQIFHYKGKELRVRLQSLIERLNKQIAIIEAKIAVTPPPQPFRAGHEGFPVGNEQNDHAKLQHLKIEFENHRTKAGYWLKECERTPRQSFYLDFKDLAWLDL